MTPRSTRESDPPGRAEPRRTAPPAAASPADPAAKPGRAPARRRRWAQLLVCAVVAALAGGGVTWAAVTVLTPESAPDDEVGFTTVAVTEDTVSDTLRLNALATWQSVPAANNQLAGTVTALVANRGTTVTPGDVIYRINERPVVIAQGSVPSYRAMREGDTGDDVLQLQLLLGALGFYHGAADGEFGRLTGMAVRDWHRWHDAGDSQEVALGEIVFVPDLPVRLALNTEVMQLGANLMGGEAAVQVISTQPNIALNLTEAQVREVPEGTAVTLTAPGGGTWRAITGPPTQREDQAVFEVPLHAPEGGSICGEECDQIELAGVTQIAASVDLVPPSTGTVVPSAALIAGSDGTARVITADGTAVTVTTGASANGLTIVEGIAVGERVRVPAKDVKDPGAGM